MDPKDLDSFDPAEGDPEKAKTLLWHRLAETADAPDAPQVKGL